MYVLQRLLLQENARNAKKALFNYLVVIFILFLWSSVGVTKGFATGFVFTEALDPCYFLNKLK